ncbi:MAG: hypothetical protein R3F61_05765 [Myxococcota bacterium]
MWTVASALALSCPAPVEDWRPPPDGVLPANGEVVFVSEHTPEPGHGRFLVEDQGVTLPGVEAEIVPLSVDTYALVPLEPLEPGVQYTLGFTLGDAADTEPPPPVTVTASRHRGISRWSGQPFDVLSLQAEGVAARWEVEVEEDGAVHRLASLESFSFGTSDCNSRSTTYTLGASLVVRARNVDWAGNVSDWTAVTVVEDPIEPVRTGGCATSPETVSSAASWMMPFARRPGRPAGCGS